jgi:hypothetical protein
VHDAFAHLRANLDQFRDATLHHVQQRWCRTCELHQADESGLCPVCRPAA